MSKPDPSKRVRNYIRVSLILLAMPILYLGLWFSISQNESLTYFEQVQMLMSYFPDFLQDPRLLAMLFFGMGLTSAVLSFYGYLKSADIKSRRFTVLICCAATFITVWLGMSLL